MTTKKPTGKKKQTDANKKEIDKLKKELKEKENKLLLSYADFKNYQKRMEKELIYMQEETKKKYLAELLDIFELLKKANEDNNPKEGLKLIINSIENFFERENIRYIDCVGSKFDHNLHHAVTTIEKNDCEDQTIVEEIKKGYMINDKLLRPSQVIVAKRNEDKEK